jgi:hypothetical protein
MPPEQLRSTFGLDLPFHDGASIVPANDTADRRLHVK